ncbi:serine hydrolase [Sporosarcina sp. Te-1]|uniref:serine hydrolase domain-containing protein n=1 Tax=Sporosarcina sp. Te-1 TaxID=2818390 RepID=UPI001A9DAE51|nr:serine hydrolase domain-containing protein [Sporosarcina sp. Te-1]QTD41042.1 beta-lactamase family protein [Sporosarcina sp. Te-1]
MRGIQKVETYLESIISQGNIPGAVLRVSYKKQTILNKAVGWKKLYPSRMEMTSDTLFDVASLTKVVATLPVVLKLVDEGLISLTDSIKTYLPDFVNPDVTIQHLLTHTSGLKATKEYSKGDMTYPQVVQDICNNSLEAGAGEKVIYSDLGFILLKEIVETASKTEFFSLIQKEIYSPLGMSETVFKPTMNESRYASTEYSDVTGGYKCGKVHDENAYYFGGISGHAGLFSSAEDLAKYATMIEQNGMAAGKQILKEETVQLSKQLMTNGLGERRGIGWQLKDEDYSPCGKLFSGQSYGHTGFTGTSLWFDPERSLYVILLTNRVHVGRKPDILTVRPKIHSLIVEAISN